MEEIPDRPAVFLLWPAEGAPYLAKTTLLRRRLKRLLGPGKDGAVSRVLRLGGVIERVEYWLSGSQLESMLLHLELARLHFSDDWEKVTRLKAPAFVRLTTANQFPRTMITTRLGRGAFYGPFASRAAAERFEAQLLDLFQLRRCEENLAPAADHPGCIYGEMNRCLRPCQLAVSEEEYRSEAARVEQFLITNGASLQDPAEAARDQASAAMQFEVAAEMHQRLLKIAEVRSAGGELARSIDRLAGVAVAPSSTPEAVELLFFRGGRWLEPRTFRLAAESAKVEADSGPDTRPSAGQPNAGLSNAGQSNAGQSNAGQSNAGQSNAGQSMDRRLRESTADLGACPQPADLAHLSILLRWYTSSWRAGEWVGFDSFEKMPYRRIVNAIARVASGRPVGNAAPVEGMAPTPGYAPGTAPA